MGGDRSDLVRQENRIQRVSSSSRRKEHLKRVRLAIRLERGDRKDGQKTRGTVEGLIADHKYRSEEALLMTEGVPQVRFQHGPSSPHRGYTICAAVSASARAKSSAIASCSVR